MSEEIIIDGVNVAECSYYNEENKPYCCEIWDNECEAQNCYYKQYLRLKQENEWLKKELNFKEKESERFMIGSGEVLEKLKQENEELKYEIDRQKETIIYLKNYDICHKTLIQYEQALEEIREIAKEYMNCESEKLPCPQSQDILNKINEALND